MTRALTYSLLILAVGCTGTDHIADPPATMDEVTTAVLTITPDMAAVEVGATQALMTIYLDETGTEVDPGAVTWTVSNISIASVDETGLVSGLSVGQVQVTASVGDVVSEPVAVMPRSA